MVDSTFPQNSHTQARMQQEKQDLLVRQSLGKVTVLEALAEETCAISPNCSNVSTPQPQNADPDDQ